MIYWLEGRGFLPRLSLAGGHRSHALLAPTLRTSSSVPHFSLLKLVSLAAGIVAFVGYYIVQITGKYPRGMWEFVLGALRWQIRLNAWQLGIVDRYPPFSTR
jgi:hypothetical protein